MEPWMHWPNRPEGHARAFMTPNVITFLTFVQRLTLEDRHFLKELGILSN
jgi:hypothetical protein